MVSSDFTHHISGRFNADLAHVIRRTLEMGRLIEQQLNSALSALLDGDTTLATHVVQSEGLVNRMEVILDEECARILAMRAPAASDLRLVLTIIKANTDLERMGDECEKIARIASRLATHERPINKYRQLNNLGRNVQSMFHDALDAFARIDANAAFKAARRDRLVDEEYEAIQRQLIAFMIDDPRTIRQALDVMWVSRALERIGDHAKNLCEHVVFLVHGQNVRHLNIEDIESVASIDKQESAPPP